MTEFVTKLSQCTGWNPVGRWKLFNVELNESTNRWNVVLKFSADGIHWSPEVVRSGEVSDRTTAFYNPFTQRWVLSMRAVTPLSLRCRYYTEASTPEQVVLQAHKVDQGQKDPLNVFWFAPDNKEKRHERYPEVDPGLYNVDVIPYESIMLGFYTVLVRPGESRLQPR